MDLDLSTLNDEQREAMLPIFTAFGDEITKLREELKNAGGGDQTEEIASLKTQLEEMQAKLDAATSSKADKGGDKKKTDDEPQGTASELEAKLAKITEQIEALTGERDSEKKAQTAQQLAAKVVAEKYPNANDGQKKSLIKRIASMQPADEAAAIAASKEVITEWTEAGVQIKGIGSDASAEGKKKAAEPGSKEARIEAIRSRDRTNVAV